MSVIAIVGGIALLAGIFGGGIKVKEVEFPKLPGWARIVSSIVGIILLCGALFYRPSTGPDIVQETPTPPSTEQPENCITAKLTSPKGSRSRAMANNFSVSKNLQIAWEPSACSMVVQYYQNNQLVDEIRPPQKSGTKIHIPKPGETEVKIWYETGGKGTLCDSTWIWVR